MPSDDLAMREHQLLDASFIQTVLNELLPPMFGESSFLFSRA